MLALNGIALIHKHLNFPTGKPCRSLNSRGHIRALQACSSVRPIFTSCSIRVKQAHEQEAKPAGMDSNSC
jgi:hypothetical protein